jgi:hypothetical protein
VVLEPGRVGGCLIHDVRHASRGIGRVLGGWVVRGILAVIQVQRRAQQLADRRIV